MCAIFGSSDVSTFEILYDANKERGCFASSVIYINNEDVEENISVGKVEGSVDFDKFQLDDECLYYTGHVQSPTNASRKWSYGTSHPFITDSWSVMHNGVITNWDFLIDKYLGWRTSAVDAVEIDTEAIVLLLQHFTDTYRKKRLPKVKIIKTVLEKLEGTFALVIVDNETKDMYITRCGSILHFNNKGDFSTMPGVGFKELKEGQIRKFNYKTSKWNIAGKFSYDSPFLFA